MQKALFCFYFGMELKGNSDVASVYLFILSFCLVLPLSGSLQASYLEHLCVMLPLVLLLLIFSYHWFSTILLYYLGVLFLCVHIAWDLLRFWCLLIYNFLKIEFRNILVTILQISFLYSRSRFPAPLNSHSCLILCWTFYASHCWMMGFYCCSLLELAQVAHTVHNSFGDLCNRNVFYPSSRD